MRDRGRGVLAALMCAGVLVTSACMVVEEPLQGTSSAPASTSGPPSDALDPSDADGGGNPVLTQAIWNESSGEIVASGLVDGTLDTRLECEFEFSGAGKSLTKQTSPEAGPSSLDCGSVYVSVDELGSGTWSVVLVYGSARSEAQEVEVP